MPSRLQQEIKKSQPFRHPEQEVFLNVLKTADHLSRGLAELFKPVDLSPNQYNVLRILRGAGADGLPCGEIAQRMITHDPDITRLLDRLAKRALVDRERQSDDRRVVKARITAAGLTLLRKLDEPLVELHKRQLGHLGAGKLKELSQLLEEARGGKDGECPDEE